jgi:tripartite-type tricarboxylate transporter receptor subunit TctC
VPYRGAAPALTDMLANQVQVMFDNLPSSIGHIQGGRLRALAVTTTTPSKALPGVPTVAETVPGSYLPIRALKSHDNFDFLSTGSGPLTL